MIKRIYVCAFLSISALFIYTCLLTAAGFSDNNIHWICKESYVAYGSKHPIYPGKEFPIKRYSIPGCTIDSREHENALEIIASECDWSVVIQQGEIEQHIKIFKDEDGKPRIKYSYYQWTCAPGKGCQANLISDKNQKDIFQVKYLSKVIKGDLPKEVKKLFYGFYGIQ